MANEIIDDITSPRTRHDYHDALYDQLLQGLSETAERGLTGKAADAHVKDRLTQWQARNPQPSCLPADAIAVTTSVEVDRYLADPDPLTLWDKIRLRYQQMARRVSAAIFAFKETR